MLGGALARRARRRPAPRCRARLALRAAGRGARAGALAPRGGPARAARAQARLKETDPGSFHERSRPPAQARLADTNANLVARALGLAGELAAAAGPAWDRAGRPLLAPALLGLADKKKQARCLIFLPLLLCCRARPAWGHPRRARGPRHAKTCASRRGHASS